MLLYLVFQRFYFLFANVFVLLNCLRRLLRVGSVDGVVRALLLEDFFQLLVLRFQVFDNLRVIRDVF